METSSTPHRFRVKLLVGPTVVALVGAAEFVCRAHAAAAIPPPAIPVEHAVHIAAPVHEPLVHPIRGTGTTRAREEVDLSFLVGGEVTWVGVDVGSRVKRGQVLAQLDTTAIAAAAARAQAGSEKAARDLDRARALEQSGSIPAASLEDVRTGDSIATATAREAAFALRHGIVVAPDDGVVDARMVDPGEGVTAGAPAFRLSARTPGVVTRVELSDRDVLGLPVGRSANVRLDAMPDRVFAGHVSRVATAASPEAGTFAVDVQIDDAGADALPKGLTAKVEIDRVAHPGAIVPVAALVPGDGDGAFVVAVDGGHARKTAVHVLFFEGSEAALADGLEGVAAVATGA